MAEFLLNQKLTIRVLLRSSPSIIVNRPVLLLLHGLSGRNMLSFAHHTNLCLLNSENYMFLELSPFSYIPTLVYQFIVRNSCAFVFIDAYYSCGPSSHSYSGMTRRNKLQYLIHISDWVKAIVSRRSKCQSSFCSALPWSVTIFMSRVS